MPTIPKEYPAGLTNDELIKHIETYSIEATVAGRPSNYVVGPSYWKEMTELGQNELTNRVQANLLKEIVRLKEEITKLKEDNEKSGKINKRLNYITISLAIITGIIGYLSLYATWPEKSNGETFPSLQLKELQKNRALLQEISIKLDKADSSTTRIIGEKLPKR